jgi:peptidoglycan/xylan/chitin deacetylase (PgdA/CDA1 family)
VSDPSHEKALSVCLSFDWDTMSVWPTAFRSESRATWTRGEFGAVAIPRLLDLFAKHGVLATFFTPGFTVLAYPDLARRIHAAGHEIAHHGWMHEDPTGLPPEDERAIIEKGLEALDRVVGVAPRGYRSPGGEIGEHAVDVLLGCGIFYESSCGAVDFHPYYLRRGDRWSPTEPYVFGEASDFVELPINYALSDFANFEFVPGWTTTMATPEVVREIWQADFDYAYENCPGGVYTLLLHPQAIGRGGRMTMFESFIEYMADHDGVRFERMDDYAARWKDANPLEEWKAKNPLLAGTGALMSTTEVR